jgi:pathogenesis-related protein 1
MIKKRISIPFLLFLMLIGMSCDRKPSKLSALPMETAATADPMLFPEEAREVLREHNKVRAEVGVRRVLWSQSLAAYAQNWADHLAASGCRLEHRPKTGPWREVYGENLFIGTAGHYNAIDAVKAWAGEKSLYFGEPLSFSNVKRVGHYTQLVWRNTREIGCGKAECRGRIIIVCNYDPPGNFLGEKPY